jgi:hypothetical protein
VKRVVVRILWLAALGAVLSCGQHSRTAPPTEDPAATMAKKNAIITLDGQITEYRRMAGLSVSPSKEWIFKPRTDHTVDAHGTCDKCVDACDLADKICDNADQICRIAKDLPADDWAKDKCQSANGSCSEAKQHCDDCRCTAADSSGGDATTTQ